MPETEDKLTILLEEMRSNFRALAEGHGSLTEKVDGLARKHDSLAGKVDGVAVDVASLKTDVGLLKTDVRTIKDHLGLNGAAPSPARNRSKKR